MRTDAASENAAHVADVMHGNEMAETKLSRQGGSLLSVDFSRAGNSARYQLDGWGSQEPNFVWSLGPTSGLRLPVPWDRKPLVLDLDVNPCVSPPLLRGQILRVRVNGHLLGSEVLTARSVLRCRIEPELLGVDETIELRFDHPSFVAPIHLRYSSDKRPLAVSFFSVRLYSEELLEHGFGFAPITDGEVVRRLMPSLPPGANAPPDEKRRIYGFSRSGTARQYLGEGWHHAEGNFSWTIADLARIDLPSPPGSGPHMLRMDFIPLTIPDAVPGQDFTVLVNGVTLGQFHAVTESTLAMPLPEEVVRGGDTLSIALHLPDARRPNEFGPTIDSRLLGLACRRIETEEVTGRLAAAAVLRGDAAASATPLAVSADFLDVPADILADTLRRELAVNPAELLREFESLGDNCEFGIVQRKMGLEVLGLLRFGNAALRSLLSGLDDEFQAAMQPESMAIGTGDGDPPEYVLELPGYNIRWHTFVPVGEMDERAVLERESVKLGYLRRRFYQGLRSGRKIYVLKHERPLTLAEAMPVLLELNRYGPNTLLYVGTATDGRRSGSVDLMAPGLMRGHLAAFAPTDDVESVDPTDWLRLAGNAMRLDQQSRVATLPAEASA
jgi:hypothetical protein